MKSIRASFLGALEGAFAAAFVGGILVGVLGWRIDSTPKIAAFIVLLLVCAISGWFIGARVAQRKTMHLPG